ncbi:sugar phosphate isomerase/epimerase [Pantoea sp. BAV 3049]|uniref:sugar phosphate isomerase/epimerase family protein n=1 Tax=Pantoea sp. BAV 3049 TaxID=2654188 RepID=UPI00131AAF68|nr:sugar phosphate isomerase/epimerase [Pantoea sp. BAV 3049]
MKREVIVVTAAYGRDRIKAMGGQQAVLPVIAAAGADGVEIRRELFSPAEFDGLPALGQAISAARLIAFYSVPEALFTDEGSLNPNIDQHVAEAQQLNAQLLKYSLGHYQHGADYSQLREKLSGLPVHLVVENDQTDCGRLSALDSYFHDCGEARAGNGMTFDMGNWLWVGDDPLQAAERLSRFVSYVHVKAAAPAENGWRAVALDEASNLWRETLSLLPAGVPRGIEFPLEGDDLIAVTRHYVDLLREE